MDKMLLQMKDMKYKDIQRFKWGEVAWIHHPRDIKSQRMSVGLVTIFPNSKHERHFHFGEEQILYVLEGKGIQVIDGKESEMESQMIMHCPPYSEHEVINKDDKNLELLIIYTPAQFGEIDQTMLTTDKVNILENIDKDILEKIQLEVSKLLKLSITFLDNENRRITEPSNLNQFCRLCIYKGDCKINDDKALSSPLKHMHRIHTCDFNILTISVPIYINGTTVGYINCGHLLIKRLNNIEKKLREISKEHSLDYEKVIKYYYNLPLVLRSRLYALGECLTIIAKCISRIIVNNITEREMIEKNNKIIEKTKETLNLENALKEANVKLLKLKVSSNLKNLNFNKSSFINLDNIEYPIEKEIELEKAVEELNEGIATDIIKDLLKNYESNNISINKAKNIVDELFTIISRVIHNEIKDIEILYSLRNEYKNIIYSCINYNDLSKHSISFIENSINLLRKHFFQDEGDLINKVNRYIKKNYTKELTLQSIANIFYISPNYLSSVFNEKNKNSLTDYINKIRIENAKKYLAGSNIKISAIGKKVGYNNLSYFSYIFKKIEKCTPKQYRHKNGR
ncbi:PocR ligand-binding domain-containing protein [Maledivibacter halophilus]|uniref:Response regulator containing CheY-like receiver domain and AraC-type DNA-binding domain n=1 Tax=Maledivibacter halophilus TaxID=36842 RepID=A0A1T5LU83_9FIRM|nr:PocR ligand-binding domain-containing protein [Maledivibacter halophilus]SKC79424.1 Response regulator containing CheY-like receiver domain and AraC-type DNA-binding domain [Maledivibacter halophilus]